MTIYCGGDFHARQQTVCYCDTTDGAIQLAELDHQGDDVHGFYSRFPDEVIVGIEASGPSASSSGRWASPRPAPCASGAGTPPPSSAAATSTMQT